MADATIPDWRLKGEIMVNCNCMVFCPCVLSLGQHPPTEGRCYAWGGVHIDEGRWGDVPLDGLNTGLMLDIPGHMSEGGWSAAVYIDDRASPEQAAGLEQIFSGAAKGTTGLLGLLVADFLGAKQVPITYSRDGKVRHFSIPKIIDGAVEPVPGDSPDADIVIGNSQYWMGPDITVARGVKGRYRDFGRVWNLEGRSAELADIDWKGPGR